MIGWFTAATHRFRLNHKNTWKAVSDAVRARVIAPEMTHVK